MIFDRSHHQEPEEEGEDWLTSYSDMMTDLLAIFVILFSFAMLNKPVVETTSSTAEAKQDVVISAAGQAIDGGNGILPAKNRIADSINDYIKEAGLSEQLSVMEQGEDVVLLRIKDYALFESGRADIDVEAEKLLGNISSILTEYKDFIRMVRIEGHTDNRPISNRQFKSNWELSTSRAVNVLKQLVEDSPLGPTKFSAVGYSEFHPIADNTTDDGRALNRRVDFIIETVDGTKEEDIPSGSGDLEVVR